MLDEIGILRPIRYQLIGLVTCHGIIFPDATWGKESRLLLYVDP